jgi:hypothetical protein
MQTSKPALELLTSDAIYRENPTALFHQLCGAPGHAAAGIRGYRQQR